MEPGPARRPHAVRGHAWPGAADDAAVFAGVAGRPDRQRGGDSTGELRRHAARTGGQDAAAMTMPRSL